MANPIPLPRVHTGLKGRLLPAHIRPTTNVERKISANGIQVPSGLAKIANLRSTIIPQALALARHESGGTMLHVTGIRLWQRRLAYASGRSSITGNSACSSTSVARCQPAGFSLRPYADA